MSERKLARSQQIRTALIVPASSIDVADLLGISRRSARVGIWVLRKQGHALNTRRRIAHPEAGRGRRIYLYTLTARGVKAEANGRRT